MRSQHSPLNESYHNHGTHVCGIIHAQVADDAATASPFVAGLAPGVELCSMSVETEEIPRLGKLSEEEAENAVAMRRANIAEAIGTLVKDFQVDLINLSLTSVASHLTIDSDELQTAVRFAWENGVLCIAAAGNHGEAHARYPAALPEVVAVSAVGEMGRGPSYDENPFLPAAAKFRAENLPFYLCSFSNYGAKLECCAPGARIFSTVPTRRGDPLYVDMSGTSMAAPMVTAVLAAHLARDSQYRALTGPARAEFARNLLEQAICRNVRLDPLYQGRGMIQAP